MGYTEAGKMCATCGKQTLHRQAQPNHILHFLIAFFTCGVWLLVWIALVFTNNSTPWICTTCGTKAT